MTNNWDNKNKLIQDSTFDLLKNLNQQKYDLYSLNIIINTINKLKKTKAKAILFFINSDIEPNIFEVIEYCLKKKYDCYIATYISKRLIIKKIENLSLIKFDYYLYTKQIYIQDNKEFNDEYFDIVYVPILNYDHTLNFIDTTYNLINNLLSKISYKEVWGYSFSFQEYQDLSEYSNKKLDVLINNNGIIINRN